MLHLILIEWFKIRRYRTFWILSGMFVLILLLWNYSIYKGIMSFGPTDFNFLSTVYAFPQVWANVAFWTKFFTGLIAIIMIILVTNEYQYRTNRQNTIDGLSRVQFFHAKWLLVLGLSFALTLFTFLLGLAFALANGSDLSFIGDRLEFVGYVFIMALNYLAFAMTLSFYTKRSGVTIVVFLLYAYAIELLLQKLVNYKFETHAGDFLPMQCAAELIPFPIFKMAQEVMNMNADGPSQLTLAGSSLAWTLVYYFLGRQKLLKSDW